MKNFNFIVASALFCVAVIEAAQSPTNKVSVTFKNRSGYADNELIITVYSANKKIATMPLAKEMSLPINTSISIGLTKDLLDKAEKEGIRYSFGSFAIHDESDMKPIYIRRAIDMSNF